MQARPPKGHMGHTVKFEDPAEHAMFLEDVQAEQYMFAALGAHTKVFSYDIAAFDWDSALRQLLVDKKIARGADVAKLKSLGELHTVLTPEWTSLDESELNKVSQSFYDNDPPFDALYRRFIRDIVARDLRAPLYWQSTPTIRFHFPNQAGFNWKPRYHTDVMLGHPPQEVNVWIPLTDCYGTNSMALAAYEPSYDILRAVDFDFEQLAERVQYDPDFAARCAAAAKPVELKYGTYVAFDPRCLHATQNNITNHTRISIDLRVLPQSWTDKIRFTYRGTGRRRMAFAPGAYYDARLSSEL